MADLPSTPSPTEAARGAADRNDSHDSSDVTRKAGPGPILIAAPLPETPERRTTINRWAAGKRKVLALVGSPMCLLSVYAYLAVAMHMMHIVPRTLWRTHPTLFILLQEAIGKIVKGADGRYHRVLNLDSSRNQDIMCLLYHQLFDGLSVNKGLGWGVIYLIPANLDECLKIILKWKNKKKRDYAVMFPLPTYKYLVYVMASTADFPVTCVGPQQRSYANLASVDSSIAKHLKDEDTKSADDVAHDADDADVELLSQKITPEDVKAANCPEQPNIDRCTAPTQWLPRDGPMTVDATWKLHVRVIRARESGEESGLSLRSPRFMVDTKTEPAQRPAPTAQSKPRNARTAVPLAQRPSHPYALRSLASTLSEDQADKRPVPSGDVADVDQPTRKRRKFAAD
ncbi:hypothetical protein BD626DRAFT_553917 [Schizophyllum amplum]|uniref:Uncharacterized protein n=1 Tax=Schizophyllum amplum TaxID=97359 RepID=A0A550CXA9_9AGAR|nr:hypothetical protein BD626DRAFT_553917 [Auriculariopsis ampla]